MPPFHPRRTLVAGLLALSVAAPVAADNAVPAPVPVSGKAKGVGMAAPAEASDTLRYEAAGSASIVVASPEPLPRPVVPLLLDTADFGFGASVVFSRIPTVKDIGDLAYLVNVQHVVVALDGWPEGYEAVLSLDQAVLPEGSDLLVILPGYPPSRAAAETWNYLRAPLRIVLLVNGPPASRAAIDELNRMRGLERLVADMEYPSRAGFERLQRPLSFRVVKR